MLSFCKIRGEICENRRVKFTLHDIEFHRFFFILIPFFMFMF
jgi:hypothetical protein